MGGKLLDPLGIFGSPQAPTIIMPPAAPPIADSPAAPDIQDAKTAVMNSEAATKDNLDTTRRRKGRAATVITGPEGAGTPKTAAKTLLGE